MLKATLEIGNLYGNMLLIINCQVSLQVIQVNSTGGYYYGLFMKLTREIPLTATL